MTTLRRGASAILALAFGCLAGCADGGGPGAECATDSDCVGGLTCVDGACVDDGCAEEEICENEVDDDCNGSVDDGCPCVDDGTPVPEDGTRLCECEGTQTCVGGVWSECVGGRGMVDGECCPPDEMRTECADGAVCSSDGTCM